MKNICSWLIWFFFKQILWSCLVIDDFWERRDSL